MLVTTEILVASVVFLTIIYAEAKLLYSCLLYTSDAADE